MNGFVLVGAFTNHELRFGLRQRDIRPAVWPAQFAVDALIRTEPLVPS